MSFTSKGMFDVLGVDVEGGDEAEEEEGTHEYIFDMTLSSLQLTLLPVAGFTMSRQLQHLFRKLPANVSRSWQQSRPIRLR